MDFQQKKLIKSEWESLEKPVSPEEKEILKLIQNGYNTPNIVYNKNQSLMDIMKLSDDSKRSMSIYLYNHYFKNVIAKIEQKNTICCFHKDLTQKYKKMLQKTSTLKKAEQIRVSNISSKLETIKGTIFEYVLLNICKSIYENKSDTTHNNYEFHKQYYTLFHLHKLAIQNINVFVTEFIKYTLELFQNEINPVFIIQNAKSIIEQNNVLIQYSDMSLYDHQTQLFNIMKNNNEGDGKKKNGHLILYQAPTGTGKTISPIGLAEGYKIIFVCAAKHVGLQLAKSCISMEIPIAIAFGCNDPGDIRLHYYAAKDIVKNFKTGGIFRVDNSVGDKVQVMVCDIKSYISAMHYMLAFNKKEEIITYWDEPTITLDYTEHEYHELLQKNWTENQIPNMILSSATLPNETELNSMVQYFRTCFKSAQVTNIISHDSRKTIPIYDSNGMIVLPHIICKTKLELSNCIKHCNSYKTILRHFDIQEIVRFIMFVHKDDFNMYIGKDELQMNIYFNTLKTVTSLEIKTYYIKLLKELKSNWNTIWSEYTKCIEPTYSSMVHITTKDAHTLTDGPTIYIADDLEKLAKVLLKISEIPFEQLHAIRLNIQHNSVVRGKIEKIEKALQEYKDKELEGASDKKVDRKMGNDPKITEYNKSIQNLLTTVKHTHLNEMYIPNKPEHLLRFGKKDCKNAFSSDIDETVVERIMMTDVDEIWKMLLLLGIGVFIRHNDVKYMELIKQLALKQRLYLILASPDYIYGTNYQFCHGYIGKDLLNMTQEKVIQAFGRVGRRSTKMNYSIRLRNDDFIKKIFFKERNKIEVENMNKLFGIQHYDPEKHMEYEEDEYTPNYQFKDNLYKENGYTDNDDTQCYPSGPDGDSLCKYYVDVNTDMDWESMMD
jgi:hypothetical protein